MKTLPCRLLVLLLAAPGLAAQEPAPEQTPGVHPVTQRELARVMSFHGAGWLERPTREEEERPEEVLDQMGLEPGDTVVDMGCGTGFFTRRMARRVGPEGTVYGVDIQPQMLEYLKRYAAEEKLTNIVPVLGEEDDPRLPEGQIDWILLVDVYHEFQKPEEMLAEMRASLAPGGRIALVEYRLEGESARHIKLEHRMSKEQVLAEWEPAGFELVELYDGLPSQYLFIFEPAD